jgi:hypothetical protein
MLLPLVAAKAGTGMSGEFESYFYPPCASAVVGEGDFRTTRQS